MLLKSDITYNSEETLLKWDIIQLVCYWSDIIMISSMLRMHLEDAGLGKMQVQAVVVYFIVTH